VAIKSLFITAGRKRKKEKKQKKKWNEQRACCDLRGVWIRDPHQVGDQAGALLPAPCWGLRRYQLLQGRNGAG
jgi:hypothetical protein